MSNSKNMDYIPIMDTKSVKARQEVRGKIKDHAIKLNETKYTTFPWITVAPWFKLQTSELAYDTDGELILDATGRATFRARHNRLIEALETEYKLAIDTLGTCDQTALLEEVLQWVEGQPDLIHKYDRTFKAH